MRSLDRVRVRFCRPGDRYRRHDGVLNVAGTSTRRMPSIAIIKRDVVKDLRAAQKLRFSLRQVFMMFVADMIIAVPLALTDRLNLALPTLIFFGLIAFAVGIQRRFCRRPWFWIIVAIFGTVNAFMVLGPFSSAVSRSLVIVVGVLADFLGFIVISDAAARFFDGKSHRLN